jgi:molybdopterin/thiamine biosynthesis adenylyltransferase
MQHSSSEGAAYLLCGQASISTDAWNGQQHAKFISYDVLEIPSEEIISRSTMHITWMTNSIVRALKLAQEKQLVVAIVHSHSDLTKFSDQDDANEPYLVELCQHRNGLEAKLLSLIFVQTGELIGRLWLNSKESIPLTLIQVVGKSIKLHYKDRGRGLPLNIFHRQALAFGESLNQDLAKLRIGVVGCGGTGSAVAMLLARLGVGYIALFDPDTIEETNLNRLHGAFANDAVNHLPKVEVIARSLAGLENTQIRTFQMRVGDSSCQDALKSCDILFGCTDDHAGRFLLNRFAYYYVTPVIDLGLASELSNDEPPVVKCLDGRVTVLLPENTCLMCREIINPIQVRDENLKYEDSKEYNQRKSESYILGEGNPSPAVVTFTTEVASMAIQELIHRLQGFRGTDGAIDNRIRKFHLMEDRKVGCKPKTSCPVCDSPEHWGAGDVEPFLGVL